MIFVAEFALAEVRCGMVLLYLEQIAGLEMLVQQKSTVAFAEVNSRSRLQHSVERADLVTLYFVELVAVGPFAVAFASSFVVSFEHLFSIFQ